MPGIGPVSKAPARPPPTLWGPSLQSVAKAMAYQ